MTAPISPASLVDASCWANHPPNPVVVSKNIVSSTKSMPTRSSLLLNPRVRSWAPPLADDDLDACFGGACTSQINLRVASTVVSDSHGIETEATTGCVGTSRPTPNTVRNWFSTSAIRCLRRVIAED